MNKQIRRLAVGLLVLLPGAVRAAQRAGRSAASRSSTPTRATTARPIRDFNRPRGPIVTADGVVLARSVPTPPGDQFKYQREYPTGDLFGNVTGYYTFSFGSTQLERTQNDVLMGDTTEQKLRAIGGLFSGDDTTGSVRVDDARRRAAGRRRCARRHARARSW